MELLLAIDPGPTESAYVRYDGALPVSWAKLPNEELRRMLSNESPPLVIEMIASYGMAVGAEVFETCVWIGRFIERRGGHVRRIYRRDVKLHLCGSARAKDANVRQALIDRYGGKERAIGRKATPGPLYGLTGDCWAALGVAVTASEVPA